MQKIRVKHQIDADTMLLIKYFMYCNVSHLSLENKYFRILLKKVIGSKTFAENLMSMKLCDFVSSDFVLIWYIGCALFLESFDRLRFALLFSYVYIKVVFNR